MQKSFMVQSTLVGCQKPVQSRRSKDILFIAALVFFVILFWERFLIGLGLHSVPLAGGHGAKEIPFVKKESIESPLVTLVILTYNKTELLRKALMTIMVQDVDFPYELIVVDNGCFDDTVKTVKRLVPDAKYVPLCSNPGYAAGNNQGVASAASSSKWLLFLNDDLEFEDNFLQSLVDMVRIHPDAGGAGCKLVSADGSKLLEAGSIIWRDGSCYPYGRDEDPNSWEYNFARPVDYVSGACLMVDREDFLDYGGFDTVAYDAYYEDTDLQMHINHALNKNIWFQPLAVARHQEHASFTHSGAVQLMQVRIQNDLLYLIAVFWHQFCTQLMVFS